MKKIGIINYGVGNIASIHNAISYLGFESSVLTESQQIKENDYIILPGVGAFGEGIKKLHQGNWVNAILEHAREKHKPFLGICLGLQLLAEVSYELGTNEGLALVPGKVVTLEVDKAKFKIPHIGWNVVDFCGDGKMYRGIPKGQDYYFVHSFTIEPVDYSIVSGTCFHGKKFVASIEDNNIWAFQFHPEKSQKVGLLALRNFLNF